MIKAFLDLLRPAPHIPEIEDPAVVDKTYKYWRIRIFYSMYIGYLFYYFTRKSFTFITPYLSTDLGLSKGDIGLLASIWAISYGISKFTSGILCDRSNPRYFMAIGLILTGVFNVLFGLSSSIIFFAIFWGLNGWFQGWGWPACTKQLTHWFSRSERGTWWSVSCTSHTVGGFLIAFVATFAAKWYGWQYGMYIPSILCIGVGIWLLNRLRDVPQSLGLPTVEQYKQEPMSEQNESKLILPVKQILFEHVLNNKFVWILAVSYFFVYIVRTAVNDWGPLYFTEMNGYSPVSAAACVSWFEVGGFFGMLVAGWGSDAWFGGRRAPLMVVAFILMIFSVIGLWYFQPQSLWLTSTWVGGIGFLVFVPQMLVGLAAAEFVTNKAASTSNGFAGCFAYLGAAVAGYPLGKVTEIWGWHGFIVTLALCSLFGAFVLFPLWNAKAGAAVVDETPLTEAEAEAS